MKHLFLNLFSVAAIGIVSAAAFAQEKVDTVRNGAPADPTIRVSTNTIVDYPGGTPPANIVGSFDAQDSTFNRPLAGCGSLSGVGTAVSYDTITLTNSGANTATLNIRLGQQGNPSAACGTVIDPYLVEYDGSFNPAAPLTNCLLVNDDTDGATDRCPSFTGISIPSGATRVYVLTTFDNAAVFDYEVTFAGTTPVSLQSFEIE